MMNIDEDFEIDAIEKCSRALGRLDGNGKVRVIRYLLDRFDLIATTAVTTKETIGADNQQDSNLMLAETNHKQDDHKEVSKLPLPDNFIALKNVLIKGLTKSEPELLLVIGFYNSKFGAEAFTRQSLLDTYRDNNIFTPQRRKNLTLNLHSLIKKSYFTIITDEELAVSAEGCQVARNVLDGNSLTKKRPTRQKRNKTNRGGDEVNGKKD